MTLYSQITIKPYTSRIVVKEPGSKPRSRDSRRAIVNKWQATIKDVEHEREPNQESLNSLGFYYYERDSKTPQEAFLKLKEYLIDRHFDEITKLQDSLEKLQELELNKS